MARKRLSSLSRAADCSPPLSEAEATQSCDPARDAFEQLRTSFERPAPHPAILEHSAKTWLTSHRALKALRRASLSKWFETQPAPSAGSNTGVLSSGRPKASAKPSMDAPHRHAPVRVHEEAHVGVIDVYERIEALARRALAAYLQFAPLGLRQGAFAELERLCREEPHAPKLRDLAREAVLVETNPELRRKLMALRERLGPG